MFDDWYQGHVFVGQAMGHVRTAQRAQRTAQRQEWTTQRPEREALTPEEQLQRAGRAVGLAFQRFLSAGLTKEEAVARIVAIAQTFGSLE